jgi:hypothetical protein
MRHDWPAREQVARDNLLSILSHATDSDIQAGLSWYPNTHAACKDLAYQFSLPLESVIGVVAAISPGLRWERNLEYASKLISLFQAGNHEAMFSYSVYGSRSINVASDILNGVPVEFALSGPKVTSFYANLLNPFDPLPVTIDGHIKSACLGVRVGNHSSGPIRLTVNRFEYPHWAGVIRNLSHSTSFIPSALQAIIWLTWRNFPIGSTV